jgi:hypothetical protein
MHPEYPSAEPRSVIHPFTLTFLIYSYDLCFRCKHFYVVYVNISFRLVTLRCKAFRLPVTTTRLATKITGENAKTHRGYLCVFMDLRRNSYFFPIQN